MFTDVFVLSPICCRLLLKALLAVNRNSEILTFSRVRIVGLAPESAAKVELNISSIDSAGCTILSFNFPSEFFLSIEASELLIAGLSTPTIANTKHAIRIFRGVSPNRIVSAQLRINVDSVQIEFYWKNGLVSSRTISAVTPSEGSSLPPAVLPNSSTSPGIRLASFAPKFFHGLLALIPDSALLWTLALQNRTTDVGGSQLCLTNALVQRSEASAVSVVEVALQQSELNRNGSYYSHSELRANESICVPLAELKHLVAIAADDALKDSFSIVFGFEECNSEPVLVVRAAPHVSTQQHCTFVVSMWYRGCSPPIRDPGDQFHHNSPVEDILFEDDNDDALFAQAADAMEQNIIPFIQSTFSQQSIVQACDETLLQETQFRLIPEWDSEIPATPNDDPAAMAIFLNDLWE